LRTVDALCACYEGLGRLQRRIMNIIIRRIDADGRLDGAREFAGCSTKA
jgi:hypothetical protein